MELEDHIPQEREVTLHEQVNDMTMFGDLAAASLLLTDTLIDFFDYYRDEPILYRMLNTANHIVVSARAFAPASFNLRRRCLTLSVDMANALESGHDIACLFLVERSRLIVNRQAHTFLPSGMDLKNHKHKLVFDLARACWSNALARCYCASTLPERIYAQRMDFKSMLMHGLAPDQFVSVLHQCDMRSVGAAYMALYQMAGQEQYHAALNRMAICIGTRDFAFVLDRFWQDMEKIANENNDQQKQQSEDDGGVEDDSKGDADDEEEEDSKDNGNGDESKQAAPFEIVVNEDGEDDKPEQAQLQMQEAKESNHRSRNGLHVVTVPDIDADSELDSYIAEVIQVTQLSQSRGMFSSAAELSVPSAQKAREIFQPLQHSVLMQLDNEEDAHRYGSIYVPHRPSSRDLAMRMQGHTPLLWETQMVPRHDARVTTDYAIYADVSVSQFHWLPYIRSVIRSLGAFVNQEHCYVFSTSVAPLDINAPFVNSSYGTEINSVVEHAQANKLANIIIITDLDDSILCRNTDGIDHIIVIVTDHTEAPEIKHTVFKNMSATTKLDMFPIHISQLSKGDDDILDKHPHLSDIL